MTAGVVAVAIGSEGVVPGTFGTVGVVVPVAVSEPTPTATGGLTEAGDGATSEADVDATGAAVEAGALTVGGGTDGTLPPMAESPNWAFWQVPVHFWYNERRFPAPHSSALLPLQAILQVPTMPGVGCARAGRESPQKHCEAYSRPAIEWSLLPHTSMQCSTVIVGESSTGLPKAGLPYVSVPQPRYSQPLEVISV